jgi:branched-chain amino acid transport system ATP-binding protein
LERSDILVVRDLSVAYGGIQAVKGIDFSVPEGALMSIIGSNGAGKSTTLTTIAGLLSQGKGSVEFLGKPVLGKSASKLVRAGLALVPEGRMVAPPLTVRENLLQSKAAGRLDREQFAATYDRVMELFPVLGTRSGQLAASLSGGEQQMLALGRALLTGPRLLMLDEPSMGLAPVMVDIVFSAIEKIHADGLTVLLVEQNAARALDICDHAIVLQRGEIAIAGRPDELRKEPAVMEAFLG